MDETIRARESKSRRRTAEREGAIAPAGVQDAGAAAGRHQAADQRILVALQALSHLSQQALGPASSGPGPDVDRLLQEAAPVIAGVLTTPYSAIVELLDGETALLRAGHGWQDPAPSLDCGPGSLLGYALRSDKAVILADLGAERRFQSPPLLVAHQVVSGICMPMRGSERSFGVLAVFDRNYRSFSDSDCQFLEAAAKILSVAVEHAQAELETWQQNSQLQLLAQLATDLLAAKDPDLMVEQLFDHLSGEFEIDAGFNYMVHNEGVDLQLQAYAGIPPEEAARIRRLRYGDAICGLVAATRQPMYVSHVQESTLPNAQLVRTFGIRAYACQPLMANGRLQGTLSFATRHRDFFTEQELSFFRTVSLYVSLAKERLHSERKLRESEERYRTLLHGASDGVLVYHLTPEGEPGPFIESNNVMCERLGYTPEEMAQLTVRDIVEPTSIDVSTMLQQLKREQPLFAKSVHISKDGRRIPTEVSAQLVELHGRPTILSICRDITERQQALQALQESQAQLRAINETLEDRVEKRTRQVRKLAAQLEQAEQEERARLARDLHDSAGQLLTALLLNLQLLEADVENGDEELRERIAEACQIAADAHKEIRAVSHALRPPVLEETNLREALQTLCQDFGQQTGLQVDFVADDAPQLNEHVRLTYYRFLQEALANTARHANASTITVHLRNQAPEVVLTIEDDGDGFVADGPKSAGLGLQNVRERFELIGGEVEIRSTPSKGTRLTGRCTV